MNRRDFLRRNAALPIAFSAPHVLFGADQRSEPASQTDEGKPARARLSELEAFNFIIGTQTIGATYQFTSESLLVETARAILDTGSNLLKFTMGRGYQRMMLEASKTAYPETMQYLLNQGTDAVNRPRIEFPGASVEEPPGNPDVHTLSDLARLEPSYRQVFEMPFAYYMIWTYAFTPEWWNRGFSAQSRKKEYEEMRAFVSYLLTTFSGTGKTFYLGHWEGDWHLRPDLNYKTDEGVTPEAIQGMTDWLNVRQKAVEDAKRETAHRGVDVLHYCEVNHVTAISMEGRPSVTNSVLPNTDVDFVSYSTYDSLRDIENQVPTALDYIESKLPSKPAVPGKRVFIGEYGFPSRIASEEERDRRSRQIMRIGLQWGCPFVLSWQIYNNEFKNGKEGGYWLIDNHGVKQPLWLTHHHFYRDSRRHLVEFEKNKGRLPTPQEFRRMALQFLERE